MFQIIRTRNLLRPNFSFIDSQLNLPDRCHRRSLVAQLHYEVSIISTLWRKAVSMLVLLSGTNIDLLKALDTFYTFEAPLTCYFLLQLMALILQFTIALSGIHLFLLELVLKQPRIDDLLAIQVQFSILDIHLLYYLLLQSEGRCSFELNITAQSLYAINSTQLVEGREGN